MYYRELKTAWAELTASGAPFEIETIEVRGTKIRSFKNALPNIRALWLSTVPFAEREYLIYQDERMTYGQAHAQVNAIATWLFREGVRPGDRVAIAMRNYPEWLLIYWACVSVGVAVVGMNAWWVTDELDYAMKDSAPKVVFCDEERLARILERPAMATGAKLVATRMRVLPAGVIPWADVIREKAAMPDVQVDGDQVSDSGYLRLYMSQLRKKLEVDPADPRHLLTESGMGYRLVLDS